jgi:hypothetical protein
MTDIYDLVTGDSYTVKKEFTDYDGRVHGVGESWVFEKTTYLPYHSGLSLFVIENGQRVIYRFQDEPEAQQELLNDFMNYVESDKNVR